MKRIILTASATLLFLFVSFAQKKGQTIQPSETTPVPEKVSKPKISDGELDPNKQPSIDSGFLVTVKMPGFHEGLAYLCYHWGKNLNIADSAIVGDNEVVVFKGDKKLVGGIYAVVFPGKTMTFDFFVDQEQKINIYADSKDLQNVKVTGSRENPLFQSYQKFVSAKGGLLQQERMAYNDSKTKEDSLKHEKNFEKYNKELIAYRDSIMSNHPKSMMAVMLNTMREPELLNKNPKTHLDSLNNYYYYRDHYWDGVTFMDERIIRTPFFIPKLERYYRDVVIQAPDSIIKDIDYRLLFARNNEEMYKFLLNWLTDEYINPKIMGQDAVFVHLFEKYHNKGETPWLNEKQMEIVTRNAYMKMMNLIGKPAPDLDMIDSTGKHRPLYEQKADYMVVVFWDPTCGHCKEEIPRIDSLYKASWKAHGVKIYSVLSDNDKYKEWVNYLKDHKSLNEWLNVYETKEMEKSIADNKLPGFRQLYDVTQTPTILLIDKDKRIIAKKLGVHQLHDFMESKWKEKK